MCRYIADMMLGFQNPISVVREHGLFPASVLESSWSRQNLTFSRGSFTEEQLEWKRGRCERVDKWDDVCVFDYEIIRVLSGMCGIMRGTRE